MLLADWIARDGLNCLKVKLRGNDAEWDYRRLVQAGEIAIAGCANWLTSDFNCTVTDPAYVNDILDRLLAEHPRLYGMILYVEQPFPYDLESHRIDVHSVSARKPLFMDESAHDWRLIKLGRELGWTGVALKTCKTKPARCEPVLGQSPRHDADGARRPTHAGPNPHVLLAAHAGTIMGVCNSTRRLAAKRRRSSGLYCRAGRRLDDCARPGLAIGWRKSAGTARRCRNYDLSSRGQGAMRSLQHEGEPAMSQGGSVFRVHQALEDALARTG